ncbi:MAG: 30S ribosomal protein S8 [Candidatus Eisenbacteria bacterium]|nr:30S ribosomal protein S8 [Candidatus Eisenbacteria bacterium]
MMTDPIADMLTRIRNASKAKKRHVDIPASKFKAAVADALLRERFIRDYKVVEEEGNQGVLKVYLRYTKKGDAVIRGLKRISRPGLRRYVGADEIPRVRSNYGTAIISTPKGVLTSKESRREHVGGEVVCEIW